MRWPLRFSGPLPSSLPPILVSTLATQPDRYRITYEISCGLREWFCLVSLKEAKKAPKGENEAKLAPSSVTTHWLESCQKPVDDNSQNQFNLGWFSLGQIFVYKENLLWGETTRVSWTFADVEVSCHRRLSSLSPPRPPPPPSLPSPPSPPWPPARSHLGRRARRRQATGAWSSRPSLLLLLLCPPAGDWSKQTCRSSSCWKPRVAITGPLRSCFLRLPIYLALHTVLRITGQAGCFLSRHQLALPTSTSLRGSSFQKTQSSLDSWTHLSPIIHGIFRKSSLRIWLSVSRFITSYCVFFSFIFLPILSVPAPTWAMLVNIEESSFSGNHQHRFQRGRLAPERLSGNDYFC